MATSGEGRGSGAAPAITDTNRAEARTERIKCSPLYRFYRSTAVLACSGDANPSTLDTNPPACVKTK